MKATDFYYDWVSEWEDHIAAVESGEAEVQKSDENDDIKPF